MMRRRCSTSSCSCGTPICNVVPDGMHLHRSEQCKCMRALNKFMFWSCQEVLLKLCPGRKAALVGNGSTIYWAFLSLLNIQRAGAGYKSSKVFPSGHMNPR